MIHALWIGAAGGAASGLLGIGGAVLMIPLLVAVAGAAAARGAGDQPGGDAAAGGAAGRAGLRPRQGGLPWVVIGCVAAGFLLGGAVGARVVRRVDGPALVRGFALFQLTVAVRLLVRTLVASGPAVSAGAGASQTRSSAFQWASVSWSLGVIQRSRAPPSSAAVSVAARSSGGITFPSGPQSPTDMVQRPAGSVAASRRARSVEAVAGSPSRKW